MSSGLGVAVLLLLGFSPSISDDILLANTGAAEPSMQTATCQTGRIPSIQFNNTLGQSLSLQL